MLMNKSRTISFFAKVAGILTLMSALEVISFFAPIAPVALAATGSVKLCNGDEQEETVSAAILYYSHEKQGWIGDSCSQRDTTSHHGADNRWFSYQRS